MYPNVRCKAGRVILSALSIVLPIQAYAEQAEGQHETCHVVGTVREEATGKPVAGAVIDLLLVSGPSRERIAGTTDSQGNYRIKVPMGTVQVWFPRLKPGYWLDGDEQSKPLRTTPAKPNIRHNLEVRRGEVWPIQIKSNSKDSNWFITVMEVESDDARREFLKSGTLRRQVAMSHARTRGDAPTEMTQVGNSGKMVVTITDEYREMSIKAEMAVESGFDTTGMHEVVRQGLEDGIVIVDKRGKKALISGAAVDLAAGKSLLQFRMPNSSIVAKYSGRVVDTRGRPLDAARVTALIESNRVTVATSKVVISDKLGRFTYEHRAASPPQNARIHLAVSKKGFAGADRTYPLESKTSPTVVGDIELLPGFSLPVQVIDSNGLPVAGAVVQRTGQFSAIFGTVRTDSNGRGVLDGLPVGVSSIVVRSGATAKSLEVVVNDAPSKNTEVAVKLAGDPNKDNESATKGKSRPPIRIGAEAVPWELGEWTDGKRRNLTDFRGKVVVLDFWGVWCRPCLEQIPALQQLKEKYENHGVVFLGIHTPGGRLDQIRRLKVQTQWDVPSAIDSGSDRQGKTANLYGIRYYPTTIILDTQGKVAFNTEQLGESYVTRMREIAESKNIEWPLDPASDSYGQNVTAIHFELLDREVKRLLRK